jgi:hypothetical protein
MMMVNLYCSNSTLKVSVIGNSEDCMLLSKKSNSEKDCNAFLSGYLSSYPIQFILTIQDDNNVDAVHSFSY